MNAAKLSHVTFHIFCAETLFCFVLNPHVRILDVYVEALLKGIRRRQRG